MADGKEEEEERKKKKKKKKNKMDNFVVELFDRTKGQANFEGSFAVHK